MNWNTNWLSSSESSERLNLHEMRSWCFISAPDPRLIGAKNSNDRQTNAKAKCILRRGNFHRQTRNCRMTQKWFHLIRHLYCTHNAYFFIGIFKFLILKEMALCRLFSFCRNILVRCSWSIKKRGNVQEDDFKINNWMCENEFWIDFLAHQSQYSCTRMHFEWKSEYAIKAAFWPQQS